MAKKKNKKIISKEILFGKDVFSNTWIVYLAFSWIVISYILTLNPSVPGGDSGELISTAHSLGVAHPPGYPLYILLGKLFSYIPHGSIAWRINLMSAVCDASAALLIGLSVFQLSKQRIAGVLAMILFAFSPMIWRYAVGAEVFALNNLMLSLLLYFSTRYFLDQKNKWLLLSSLVFGLGLGNHHTLVFFGITLIAFVIWQQIQNKQKLAIWFPCLALGFLGFSIYLFLPWAAGQNPDVTWGDQTTWDGFLKHLLRKEYGTFKLASLQQVQVGFFEQIYMFVKRLFLDSFGLGLLFSGFAIFVISKFKKTQAQYLWPLCAFIFYTVVFHYLANLPLNEELAHGVQERFWQAPYVIFCLCFGLGLAWMSSKFTVVQSKAFFIGIFVILVCQYVYRYALEDRSDNYTFKHTGQSLLKPLPKNAIFLTSGDVISNSARYLQRVEKLRQDVIILDLNHMGYQWFVAWAKKRYPLVVFPKSYMNTGGPQGFTLKEFFDSNKERKIFISLKSPGWDKQPDLKAAYREWPMGLLREIKPIGHQYNFSQVVQSNAKAFSHMNPDGLLNYDYTTWERSMNDVYWNAWVYYADTLMAMAEQSKSLVHYQKVLDLLTEAERRRDFTAAGVIKNIGTVHVRLAAKHADHLQQAINYYQKFLKLAGPKDPNRSYIANMIEQYQKFLADYTTKKADNLESNKESKGEKK